MAIANQKGGCGKTTVAINLASALAELGKSVLLVDMDPQSHCAVGLAVRQEQIEQSIYDVLISRSRNEPIRLTKILRQISERLKLAPASIDLSDFEQQMVGSIDRENCLRNVLDDVKDEYDYIVIDCPPAVSLLMFNALRAASDVVVPVEMGYFALHGLSKQLETLSVVNTRCQQGVSVWILANMCDDRTKAAREILTKLRSHFGDRMFNTVVNDGTRIKEAASFGQPINEYDPASKGQQDFRSLAQEVIDADNRPQVKSKRVIDALADQLESIVASTNKLLKATKAKPKAVARARSGTSVVKPIEPVSAPPQTTDEKLAEYYYDFYGARQIGDVVVFRAHYPLAQTVQLAGDFNKWQPVNTPMQRVGDSGVWQVKMELARGIHYYRLVVDGLWQQDSYNDRTIPNPYGDLDSVVKVE
jgi:chromosome partitioning protein